MPFGDKSQYEYLAEALCKEFPALQKQGSDPAHNGVMSISSSRASRLRRTGGGQTWEAWQLANNVPSDLDGYYR